MVAARPTWRDLVRGAAGLLTAADVPAPRVDARLLAEHLTGTPLVIAPDPTAAQVTSYAGLVERRARREPLQHITGEMHFRHLRLEAGASAFVVRPETEMVAEAAIGAARQADSRHTAARHADMPGDGAAHTAAHHADMARDGAQHGATTHGPRVVDLCSGSGAIALAVATEVPSATVWAVEISDVALALAARNVAALAPRVTLVAGDAATALPELDGSVDVVVANPPYVPPDAVPRDAEVREHDPDLALYGGGLDGLDVPRAVLRAAARLLRPGGTVVMEHAEVQAAAVRQACARTGTFTDVRTEQDLTGRDRMVVARRAGA